jgi:hypothetical protein
MIRWTEADLFLMAFVVVVVAFTVWRMWGWRRK